MMKSLVKIVFASLIALAMMASAQAAEKLKPFVLAYKTGGDMASVVAEVKQKLSAGGFEVVGSYAPYDTATVIVVTNDSVKQTVAKSKYGGYGAGQRVTVTRVGNELQVSYTNPTYMAHAYRMKGDMADVTAQFAKVLGKKEVFGPEKGLEPDDLREYHYMFGMEYFTDPSHLAQYKNHEEALKKVEEALAKGKGGASKVYRIDIPGKDEVVFGVALKDAKGKNKAMDDSYIMSEIDFKPLRSTGHLPYEMLVSGRDVYALYARFRIAINFPDLSMMGKHSFMNIMDSPDAIKNALIQAAGAELENDLF